MSRVLTPTATRMLSRIPAYYRRDPLSQAVMLGMGGRVDEVEAMTEQIRAFMFPQLAGEDGWGSLAYWERLMRLPVEPAGVPEARRLAVVLAHWRKRRAKTGAGWVELVTLLLGTSLWTHEEGPVPGHITITVSNLEESYVANQIARLVRDITPAGYVINFVFTGGFLIGFSTVGSGPLL